MSQWRHSKREPGMLHLAATLLNTLGFLGPSGSRGLRDNVLGGPPKALWTDSGRRFDNIRPNLDV